MNDEKKMRTYRVEMEGYICTGNCALGKYRGIYSATSPRLACRKALKDNGYDMKYWDYSSCSWWGCKVTANEL